MRSKGEEAAEKAAPPSTREKILDAAMGLLLKQGFDGTSLDQVLAAAGVTKGAFFYYFKSKDELAHAVMDRFVEADRALSLELVGRATKLSRDPLEQVLLLVGLLAEMFEGLGEPHPGCLIASYCYQKNLMTEPLRELAAQSLLQWRDLIVERLRRIAKERKPSLDVDLASVADLLNSILEGAFVLSKTFRAPKMVAEQLQHYRNYLELLFPPHKAEAEKAIAHPDRRSPRQRGRK